MARKSKVKIKDTLTVEGKKFNEMLYELKKLQVRIGFQHGKATEEDGTDICDVAAWNELGTKNMPSRPFLRKSVDENRERIDNFLQSTKDDLVRGKPAEKILKDIGIFQKDLIQEKITEGSFKENADSTIEIKRKKGRDEPIKPLIDTGKMRQSVNYVIEKKRK